MWIGGHVLFKAQHDIQAKSHWDSVTATIVSTSSTNRSGKGNPHCDGINISYDYHQVVYLSHLELTNPCHNGLVGLDYTNEVKTRFPDGAAISAIVNPSNPSESSDVYFGDTPVRSFFLPLAFILFGLMLSMGTWMYVPPKVGKM